MCWKLILSVFLINSITCISPFLEYSTPFPIKANSTFRLIFSSVKEYKFLTVIRLEILKGSKVFSKTLIYLGISDQMEGRISNEYLWLENWYKDSYGKINVLLRLLSASNDMWLCVSFHEPISIAEKNKILNVPCTQHSLILAHIELIVYPLLDLSITTKDGRRDGVHNNENAIIECISSRGVPPYPPSLSHPSSLCVKSRYFNKETNTAMLYFRPSINDHGKIISCTAGQSITSATIYVFHNPSSIYLRPSYYHYLSNGSSIQCISKDGYPKPKVSWIFIKGPEKSSTFYRISPSYNLTMSPLTPIGSSWTFNCSSINSITKSYDTGISKTFTFTIYPGNRVTTIIVTIVIPVIGILFLIIVSFCNRKKLCKKIEKCINSRSRANKDGGENTPNNLSSSYFTYPNIPETTVDPGLELEFIKPHRKSRKQKVKCDSDIFEEDNIV